MTQSVSQTPAPKKGRKKWVILGILALLVIIIIATTSGGDDAPAVQSGPASTGAAPDPQAPPAFPGATEDDVVAKPGEAVTLDEVTMTATALKPLSRPYGSPMLCTDVTYQNGSTDTTSFNGGFDWKLQDPNGAILMNTYGSPNALNSGQLAPGGKTSGEVCFEAPSPKASGQYIVLLDPSFRLSDGRIAWLNQL